MSLSAMYDALDGLFTTIAFNPSRVIPPNVTYQPTANLPYLIASYASYVRRPLTLGRDKHLGAGGYLAEHRGVYRIEVVWPQDAGRPGATLLQGQVLSLFQRGTTLTDSDGDQVVIDAPTALPLITQDAWLRGPVNCPWYCFEAS